MTSQPSDRTMIEQHARLIVRCRIVDGGVGSNGSPPRGEIDVLECLCGQVPLGRQPAVFEPPTSASWFLVRDGGSAALAAWHAQPLHGPEAGQSMILVAEPEAGSGALRIWHRCRYADDAEHRAFVAACLARRG